MKKTLAVLVIALIICTSVFASHRITATVDPFAFQFFVQKDNGVKDVVNSKYGLGGGIGYNWEFGKGFMLGADIKADTYFIEDQKNFTDISFLAKFGYIVRMGNVFGLYTNVKGGLDLQAANGKTSAVLEFGPEVGVEFKLNEHFDLFASCEGLFGFPRKDGIKYGEFRVTPTIGMGFTF